MSNSADFDKKKFGRYLKCSLKELFVVLNQADNLMCYDEEQYLRHLFFRIEHLLKVPIPQSLRNWLDRKANFPDEELETIQTFMLFHQKKLEEQLAYRSTHPLWAIESNWYTTREKIPIDPIRYFRFELDNDYVILPEV